MYSVLKSYANELQFFRAYLEERYLTAALLGKAASFPTKDHEILAVGADISFEEVQSLYPETMETNDAFSEVPPPSFMWYFPWRRYIVLGIPDGLSKTTILERKRAANDYFAKTASRPIARTQADLYGVFFRRTKKLVQIEVVDGGTPIILDEDVDRAGAR